MEFRKDLQQDDIVDSAVGFGVSLGFFLLVAIIFTVVSLIMK